MKKQLLHSEKCWDIAVKHLGNTFAEFQKKKDRKFEFLWVQLLS